MTISILGAGVSFPKQIISNEFLSSLDLPSDNDWGVNSRNTVLPLDYISSTRNRDVFEANKNANETVTSLITEATEIALKRANIDLDDIGLIVGDTATPLETTPSEAQRLGRELEIKVPAYDIGGLHASLGNALCSIANFTSTSLPDYILVVHGDTPTRVVKYESPEVAPAVFGDAAGAIVLSTKKSGPLRIKETLSHNNEALRALVKIPMLSNLGFDADKFKQSIVKEAEWIGNKLGSLKLDQFFCNCLLAPAMTAVYEGSVEYSQFESLGTEGFIGLDYIFNSAADGSRAAIALAGVGHQSSMVVIEKD